MIHFFYATNPRPTKRRLQKHSSKILYQKPPLHFPLPLPFCWRHCSFGPPPPRLESYLRPSRRPNRPCLFNLYLWWYCPQQSWPPKSPYDSLLSLRQTNPHTKLGTRKNLYEVPTVNCQKVSPKEDLTLFLLPLHPVSPIPKTIHKSISLSYSNPENKEKN